MKFFNSKTIKFVLVFSICFGFAMCLSGCVSMATGIYIEKYPSTLVYQIGEVPNFSDIQIKTINTDGTHRRLYLSQNEFPKVDTSTSGVKEVVIQKDGLSVSFDIYVANVVVNDSDNIKQIFAELKDGDIVYLRAGNYDPQNESDQRYKDVEITKSVTLVGDGADKTKFFGNFLVGATVTQTGVKKVDLQNVLIRDIGFQLDFEKKDGLAIYEGPYGNTDTNGAIRFFDTKNLTIQNCSFANYAYGVLGDNANGLTVFENKFCSMLKSAICIDIDTQNTLIAKNIILDTAQNVVSFSQNEQEQLGAVILSFATDGAKGVIVCKNTINRTGFHRAEVIYYDQNSKDAAQNTNQKIFELTYINNTAGVTLKSSGEDNLKVTNVVLSTNNLGQALANIKFSTNSTNSINPNGIIILE